MTASKEYPETIMEQKVYNEYVKEAKSVREEVFIYEQGFSYDYDQNDDIAAHIVMFASGVPIAACRVFESENIGTFVLGRLAVKKEYRGRGIGSRMVQVAKEYATHTGGKNLILHSQLQAKEFYSKLGFAEYGDVEYEEDCPHIWMKAEL